MSPVAALDPSSVRLGHVRGRYFRENFAQGGVDLVQIIPELVTNADAAIAASGRASGRIALSVGAPDPEFLSLWRARMRSLRSPALISWKHELRCTDDGEGVDAGLIDARLGALGVEPPRAGQRGLFGRGLRDVWLAQGAGRIQGVRAGMMVESWFFPAPGDEPYAFVHVREAAATPSDLKALGVAESGTRVTVPLAAARLPSAGRLRALVAQLVQLRPVLEDPSRAVYLEQPGQTPQLITYPAPEPDPERPVLFDDEVQVAPSVTARIVVRRAKEPLSQGFSRATRRGGLVIRSGRAAHETTLAGFEGRPGTQAPLWRGVLRRDRAAPARRAGQAASGAGGEGRPLRAQRASPDRRCPVRRDRPGAAADRRRRGTPRRHAPDRSCPHGHCPRSGRSAGDQRPTQGCLRSARHGRVGTRQPAGRQTARAR